MRIGSFLSLLGVVVSLPANCSTNQLNSTVLLESGSGLTELIEDPSLCPVGFKHDKGPLKTCVCDPGLKKHGIECGTNFSLIVPNGMWVGPISGRAPGSLAVHNCWSQYCEDGRRYVDVGVNELVNFNTQCRKGFNREGILCGTCKSGYSSVFGSERCRKCSDAGAATLLAYLAAGLILVYIVVRLRINITAGYLNGVIFYSNIVSIYGPFLNPTAIDGRRLFLAKWLTLNLGIEACFHKEMGALERIWWEMSFPLYILALMVFLTLLSRWFLQMQKLGHSLVQAYATLSILCYVSLLEFTVQALAGVQLESVTGKHIVTQRWLIDTEHGYFKGLHAFLAVIAIAFIVVYFVPLSLFLLFPRTLYSCRFRIFQKPKPFYDAFWDPFRPQYRYWLALRLFFRWLPFMLAYFAPAPLNVFVTAVLLVVLLFLQLVLRPFRGLWRNVIDSYFIANLIVLLMGGLYFRVQFEGGTRDRELWYATAFSTTVVTLGYIGFVVVLVYHLNIRFPNLRHSCYRWWCCLKCRHSSPSHSVAGPRPSDINLEQSSVVCTTIEHNTASSPLLVRGRGEVRHVDFTVLRESLLASRVRTVETHSLST